MTYQVTGNEYVSLPTIRENDGALESISCLYMNLKGMLELKGKDAFLKPAFHLDGKEVIGQPLTWKRTHCWIPSFSAGTDVFSFRGVYLTPIGERGFAIRLEAANHDSLPHELSISLRGEWEKTLHTVNESIPLLQGRSVIRSHWNDMFIFQQVPGIPLLAFAPVIGDHSPFSEVDQDANWEQHDFSFRIWKSSLVQPGECICLDIFFGLGYEEVAASASAKEMLRQGFEALAERTDFWLADREKTARDPQLSELLNTNLFFAFFYASGRTIDTEELCMMTSRSPRYYVSAAYWDRDSLLWAFPAILEADPRYARELLSTVYRRQSRNFGIHSRYIDGTVLEPGFELDELCAPVIALDRYIQKTSDTNLLHRPDITESLENILLKLAERKHASIPLYSTFLQPTDDKHNYPYLTYDNVLVWRTYTILGNLLNRKDLLLLADQVRSAIEEHCVFLYQNKSIYAWSTDLNGHWDIYDEPPGSLQLLPFYGFCGTENKTWQNTVSLIRDPAYTFSFADHPISEIGCKHAPHPWILSICNSLLSGYRDSALRHLAVTKMDNGLACESVHEDTGECTTGEAFATCAGFLAYALLTLNPLHPQN